MSRRKNQTVVAGRGLYEILVMDMWATWTLGAFIGTRRVFERIRPVAVAAGLAPRRRSDMVVGDTRPVPRASSGRRSRGADRRGGATCSSPSTHVGRRPHRLYAALLIDDGRVPTGATRLLAAGA